MARRSTLDALGGNDIDPRHSDLKEALAQAEEQQYWWSTLAQAEQFQELMSEAELRIHNAREGLETAKGDDIKTLQADIRSRREFIHSIEYRISMDPVNAAKSALRNFESENALFVQAVVADAAESVEPEADGVDE